MKTFIKPLALSIAVSCMALSAGTTAVADDTKEITVGYFLEWPTPNQFAQVNGDYEKALGVKINWRSFDTGTAMSAAMASGDVNISFSQGIPPFVVATSSGLELQVVDVALSYSDNDNCVVSSSLKITKDNVKELEGKKVAVPIGTAAHYGMLKQMEHFGVDVNKLQIVDMAPADSAAALTRGDLAMACGWGGPLRRMKESGNVLLTGAEKEELGIRVFDATTVPTKWAKAHPELVAKFLKVTADMNKKFADGGQEEMLPVIAKAAGMDVGPTKETMAAFTFPSIEEQLGEKWLGGGTQKFLKVVGDFFVEQKQIPKALDNYDSAVDASYLQAASKL